MFKYLYDQSVLWQMNAADRMAIHYIINGLNVKDKAIEVGSYYGGCTRHLSKNFKNVISIDLDHSLIVDKDKYTNVEWVEGDSKIKLREVLLEHNDVDFILIDGDHNYNSVYNDVEACLFYKWHPIILVHDAAYEMSKEALIDLHVKYGEEYIFDIDFVPGVPFNNGSIGGFALIHKK